VDLTGGFAVVVLPVFVLLVVVAGFEVCAEAPTDMAQIMNRPKMIFFILKKF
jgi:hypothetical protein